MRGVVYIERESTAGDRAVVRTLDVEGFPNSLGDPMEIVRRTVAEVLIDPEQSAYTVRAIHDVGGRLRTVHRRSFGDQDRPTMAALEHEAGRSGDG